MKTVATRALSRWSVHPRPFMGLVWAFVRMDLRSAHYGDATATKAGDLIPPLFWVVGQFLATSALLSLALFTRVDAWFFAFANLSITAVLIFSALVVELHEVVFDPNDAEVIGHRPLPARTYAAARLANLFLYVGLMGVATAIFPAIFGAALRDGGWRFSLAFAAAQLSIAVATASAVILLYTAGGQGPSDRGAKERTGIRHVMERLRGLLAWVQIAAILVVFYGAQLMLRDANGGVEMFAARPPEWVRAVPTAWLADFVVVAHGPNIVGLLAAAGVAVGLAALAGWQLARAWSSVASLVRAQQFVAPGELATRATHRAGVASLLSRTRAEALSFWLVRTMLHRDPDASARTWPAMGLAVAAVVMGAATGQLANPLIESGAPVVLSLSLFALLPGAAPILIHQICYARDHQASWLLQVAPVSDPGSLAAGARRAVLLTFFAPALGALFVLLAWIWRDPLHAACFCIVLALGIELALLASQAALTQTLPFAKPPTRGGAVGHVSIVSGAIGASGALAAALLHAMGPRFSIWIAAAGLLLFAVTVVSARARRHR